MISSVVSHIELLVYVISIQLSFRYFSQNTCFNVNSRALIEIYSSLALLLTNGKQIENYDKKVYRE